MSGTDQDALPDVRELSVDSPGCPAVVGRTSQMSENDRMTLPDAWEWSRGYP